MANGGGRQLLASSEGRRQGITCGDDGRGFALALYSGAKKEEDGAYRWDDASCVSTSSLAGCRSCKAEAGVNTVVYKR